VIDVIRLGGTTDHGGKVITASDTMRCRDVRVARKGDVVTCPQLIVEGDETMCDAGIPVARHGHHATWACRLISSLI
jgi:uncharacterized Zn-binding protein involved in type VI secretion